VVACDGGGGGVSGSRLTLAVATVPMGLASIRLEGLEGWGGEVAGAPPRLGGRWAGRSSQGAATALYMYL
jgi:hypothetical protein